MDVRSGVSLLVSQHLFPNNLEKFKEKPKDCAASLLVWCLILLFHQGWKETYHEWQQFALFATQKTAIFQWSKPCE